MIKPTPTLDDLNKILEISLENILGQNYVDEHSGGDKYIGVDEIANQLKQAIKDWVSKEIIKELDKLALEVIEPCEPDCDEVRHARHEGSWNAHLKIEARADEQRKKLKEM